MTKGAKYTLIVCLIAMPVLLTAAVTAFYWNHIRAEYYFRWGERPTIFKPPRIATPNCEEPLFIARIPTPESLSEILVADKRVRKSFLQSPNIQKFLEAAILVWLYSDLTREEKALICRRYIALLEDTQSTSYFWGVRWYSKKVCDVAVSELNFYTMQSFGMEFFTPRLTGFVGNFKIFTTDPEKAKKAIAQWKQWYEENKEGELFPGLKEKQ